MSLGRPSMRGAGLTGGLRVERAEVAYRRRRRRTRQRFIAAALTSAAALSTLPARSLAGNTWDGGGSNNDWTTNNNWFPDGDPANNGTENITFAGNVRLTPNLNSSWSILSLTFASNAGAFTLGSSLGRTLTIGSGGLSHHDDNLQTITHALALGAGQSWNTASTGSLLISGAVNLNAGTLTTAVGGDMALTGAISGTGGIAKNGSGNLALGGADVNSFSGVTTLNAGTLLLGKTTPEGAVTGNLTIGDGAGTDSVVLLAADQIGQSGNTVTVNASGVLNLNGLNETLNNIVLAGGQITGGAAASTLTLLGTLTHNPSASSAAIGGNLSLVIAAGNKTLNVADGAAAVDLDIAAAVSQDLPGRSITKTGPGTLRLAGNSSFSGGLTVNTGTVILADNVAAGTGAITVADGATVKLEAVRSMTNVVNLAGGVATFATDTLGDTATLSGAIIGGGGLAKSGAGVLILTAANTFAGKVGITDGRLGVHSDAALGALPGAFIADAVTLDGGTVFASATSLTIHANRGITVGAVGGTLRANNAGTFTVASKLTGAGSLTLAPVGAPSTLPVIALAASNTSFSGKTTVDGVVLSVTQDANLSAVPGAPAADQLRLTNGGTLKVGQTFAVPSNRGITLLNGGAGGAIEVDSAQTLTVLAPLSGSGNLTKKGPGTLNLVSSVGSYTGRTIIDSGTVIAQQDANVGAPPAMLVADQLTINAAALRWNATGALHANRGVRLGASGTTISVDPNVTMTVNAPVSGPGGLTKTGTGTLSFFGTNTYAAATAVGSGRMILNAPFSTATSIAVSAGAVLELAEATVATVKTSSITATGKVDVKNNKVILTAQPIGTFNGAAYTGVSGLIDSAHAGGTWTGNGLTTTLPAALSGLTSLGVATADQTGYAGGTFGGVSVGSGNVLVMYTYRGDANLDGFISGDDYSAIDFAAGVPGAAGWINGDFNYDGVISGDDYSAIDFNLVAQGPPISTTATIHAPLVTPVPEPASSAWGAAAAAFLAVRRRRSRLVM